MSKNNFPRIEIPSALKKEMIEAARGFRKEPTRGEAILWNALRGKRLDGVKFRRQQPVGPFVVDFYNSGHRLVIEVDGPIHDLQKEADCARQEMLEGLGLKVLHLKAEMVENDLPAALEMIRSAILASPPIPNPSPLVGEGRGGGR
jgi:very-short-patch-repair endonuclease